MDNTIADQILNLDVNPIFDDDFVSDECEYCGQNEDYCNEFCSENPNVIARNNS